MKKIVFLTVLTLASITTLHAQLITWAVKPGMYSEIEPCWGNLYLAYMGDNVGVINGDGKVVVSAEASRITGFYNDLALVLKSEGGKERIMGILSTNGAYTKIDGVYYAIPYQEFFSEGLLTVTDSRGQAGFMNENGIVVKSFKESFVSPFSEGYAVVGMDTEYRLIDKRFNTLNIQLGTVSPIYGGSNVYKGVAVIWDGNGKFYHFDAKKGTCIKGSAPSSYDYDYMYCFSSISKRSSDIPYEQPKRSAQTLTAIQQNGKYGYESNGKVVLPYQFEQAENFHGNYAIVKTGGKCALLMLHNTDDAFNAIADAEIKYRKRASKDILHKFGISVPSLWDIDDVTVRVTDPSGITVNTTNSGSNYEFKADGAMDTQKYGIEISCDGLKLYNGEIAYIYQQETTPVEFPDIAQGSMSLTVSLVAENTEADQNNRCYVKAIISNPTSETVTATVTMSGSNLLEAVSRKITIKAHDTETIRTYFTVNKATSGQKVTVTTSAGGIATLDGLQLIPF